MLPPAFKVDVERGSGPEASSVYRRTLGPPVRFFLISLFIAWITVPQEALAQFGAGRSRDSIFNRRSGGGRSGAREDGGGGAPQPPPQQFYQDQQQPAAPPPQYAPVDPGQPPAPPPQPVPNQPQIPIPVPQPGVPGARPAPPGARVAPPDQPGQPQAPTQGIPPEGHIVLRTVPVNLKADVGEEFVVHVWLDNPLEKPFNLVSFALAYDPRLLEFVDAPGGVEGVPNGFDRSDAITQAMPLVRDPREDPFYLNLADPKAGMVYYRARSASGENITGQGFLLSMKFRALKPVRQTGLRFIFADWPERLDPPVQSDQTWDWPGSMTFVGKTPSSLDSASVLESLLGSDGSTRDGVISGNLTLKGDYLAEVESESTPQGDARTRIFLQPGIVAVQAGKTFDLNVNIANPEGVAWDRVRLDIRYDPEYLAVVDQDEGNWINRGVNILDGPYHDRFPFEWMRNNLVREDAGRILYECGVFQAPLRAGGTLATIRLRALRPIPETKIVFNMPSDVSSLSGTILTRKRQDVLADVDYSLDGVAGATVVIVPARREASLTDSDRRQLSEKE